MLGPNAPVQSAHGNAGQCMVAIVLFQKDPLIAESDLF